MSRFLEDWILPVAMRFAWAELTDEQREAYLAKALKNTKQPRMPKDLLKKMAKRSLEST